MTRKDKHYYALLLSAGSGSRMKSNDKKQFLTLKGSPLFIWAIRAFLSVMEDYPISLFLTYSSGDLPRFQDLLSRNLTEAHYSMISLVEGGNTRSESVYHGLTEIHNIANDEDSVLIHDCARPFIQKIDILKLIESLNRYPAATLGYTITDTFKKVDPQKLDIEEHLDRDCLRGILTPQAFHFGILWQAYEKYMLSPYPVTDDTELIQRLGHPVTVVEGSKSNIKITTTDDLSLAEYYAQILGLGDRTV